MLILIKDEQFDRPYRLYKALEGGNTLLWATYLIRKSAVHQAQKEAKRLCVGLANYVDKERRYYENNG